MTETDYQNFLNSPEYPRWKQLHEQITSGKTLSVADQAFYDAINRHHDELEAAMLNRAYLERARQLRQRIAAGEEEISRLREKRDALTNRIRELEALLDEPTRRALDLDTANLGA